jgi:paraquat-inducible protein B
MLSFQRNEIFLSSNVDRKDFRTFEKLKMELNLENLEVYTTTELEKAHRKIGKVLEKRAGGELKQIRKQVQKLAGALGMEITVKADGILKPESEMSEAEEELPEAHPAVQATEETAAAEETPSLPQEEMVTERERPKKRKASSKQTRRYPLKPRRAS